METRQEVSFSFSLLSWLSEDSGQAIACFGRGKGERDETSGNKLTFLFHGSAEKFRIGSRYCLRCIKNVLFTVTIMSDTTKTQF